MCINLIDIKSMDLLSRFFFYNVQFDSVLFILKY